MDTVYFSYWSGGLHMDYGRLLTIPSVVKNLHQFSLHYAKKHYKNVCLITDTKCLPFFEKLPYTNITTELDDLNNLLSGPNFNWALGKLFTYNILATKNIPFIHLDYDVFIWKPFTTNCWSESVLVQSIESPSTFLDSPDPFERIYGLVEYKKYGSKNYINEYDFSQESAYNVGIFGGADTEFIKLYAKKAIEFSIDPENYYVSKLLKQRHKGIFPCLCEQYLLARIAEKNNKKVFCYLGEDPRIKQVDFVADQKGYCHFHGLKTSKKDVDRLYSFMKEKEKIEIFN